MPEKMFARTIADLHAGTAAEPVKHALKRYGRHLLAEEFARGILPAEQALLDKLR